MGRALRIDGIGKWHHVMNRGAGRRVVFADDRERRRFLDLLGMVNRRFGLETHAYCLMGNHFHLLVRSTGSLSAGMQYLSSAYTRRVNYWRGVDGPIFRGRFTSVPVVDADHLFELVRYIHLNPVEAGLVATPREYWWSSLPALLGDRPSPPWLHTTTVLAWFGNHPGRLLEHVTAELNTDGEPPLPGNDVEGAPGPPQPVRVPDPATTVALVAEAVGAGFGHPPDGVLVSVRGRLNVPRLAFFILAVDHMGLSPKEVSTELGVSRTAVRTGVHRARERLRVDSAFGLQVADSIASLRGSGDSGTTGSDVGWAS